MSAVYKALTKASGKADKDTEGKDVEAKKYRQKVLLLSSRGVTSKHRHLLNDLDSLLPHARKESKFHTKSKLYELVELADLYNCNNVLFFEARKAKDLYMWFSKVPNGPTIKFHVENIQTMDELHFLGNCIKGTRPILSFDAAFDQEPYLQLIKEVLFQILGTPPLTRGAKPFVDRVMGFSVLDGKIWVRNYEIREVEKVKGKTADDDNSGKKSGGAAHNNTDIDLLEIGPRFVLTPIVIQEGSFGGPILYENKRFISPNHVRAEQRRSKAVQRNARAEQQRDTLAKRRNLGLTKDGEAKKRDELDTRELFS